MTLVFLFCPAVVISFLVGFVRYQVTVLSQTLQLAPRALPQVQAGSGRLEKYLGRPIKNDDFFYNFSHALFKLYCTMEFQKNSLCQTIAS